MTATSILFAVLFYAAFAVLVLGLAFKVRQYTRTPAPLKIPTTPAPTTRSGAALRVAREVLVFESLFKSQKWLWIFAILFHFGLLLVTIRHLRYFLPNGFLGPVWDLIVLAQPFGIYAGFAMAAGLAMLLLRRIVLQRVRYITGPSDILMLLLLLAIGGSGLMMKFVAHTDVVQVKAFFMGLITFNWQPLPTDTPLMIHLSLVLVLMFIFPFSKLLHVPGVFFSPTRNQADDPRENRHVAPWASKYDDMREA